jgi:hypothetical protein
MCKFSNLANRTKTILVVHLVCTRILEGKNIFETCKFSIAPITCMGLNCEPLAFNKQLGQYITTCN